MEQNLPPTSAGPDEIEGPKKDAPAGRVLLVRVLANGELLTASQAALPPEPVSAGGPAVARVELSVDLPVGSHLHLILSAEPTIASRPPAVASPPLVNVRAAPLPASVPEAAGGGRPARLAPGAGQFWRRAAQGISRAAQGISWAASAPASALFAGALAVYLVTHLAGLTRFPIYFFTDEAVQTVLAADLVRDGFRNYDGVFLPTFFKNGSYYNLGLSVYLQVLPFLLFGKSVLVTRLASGLATLLCAASLGLALRDAFGLRHWWLGTSLLAIAPAWFLHSRTAFETTLFVSLYAAALYAYLLYRLRTPHYLYAALILSALAFYSYSPGQVVVVATAMLLLVSDAPYHWKQRRFGLRGLGLLALLAVPYLRFRLYMPGAPEDHLRQLGSYWLRPIALNEKLAVFTKQYFYALSPGYWFLPNGTDLARHLMKGYGHLLRFSLPFAALGLAQSIWRLRSPAHRAVLAALLAAPAGTALVGVGITRVLVFIVPATLLTALGMASVMDWLASPGRRWPQRWQTGRPAWLDAWRLPPAGLALGVFVGLSAICFGMLNDALANGPRWYHDYGLGGMQYGGAQLFSAVADQIEKTPHNRLIISPSWANGTDVIARFFLGDPLPVELGSIEGHIQRRLPLDDEILFVMIPDEYEKVTSSGKFQDIRIEQTLPYPDGRNGFYFVRLRYVDNIDGLLAAEAEQRRALQQAVMSVDGQMATVKHPVLDIGQIGLVFDGDPHSLVRTLEANPAVIEIEFSQPRRLAGLAVTIGSIQAEINVQVTPVEGGNPHTYAALLRGSVEQPEVVLDFQEIVQAQALHLEVRDPHQGEPGHIHIWDIRFIE